MWLYTRQGARIYTVLVQSSALACPFCWFDKRVQTLQFMGSAGQDNDHRLLTTGRMRVRVGERTRPFGAWPDALCRYGRIRRPGLPIEYHSDAPL